ncbi:hypothetical protein CYY_002584 [Polysphondylium violaceum]|uniref:Monalysin Pore-forming domain-containing protein n=1 Tax=Polysphondylium violaceum TaxID=133409 RepID=A0A8J4Q115_9MYCE|nr:hypothetical protein CYY_002584 [Polysphondylium violaceum]
MSTERGPLHPSTLNIPLSLSTADGDIHKADLENAKKIGVPTASSNFDPAKSRTCNSNFEIDEAIKLKSPPDSMVMVNAPWTEMAGEVPFKVKPICAYMNYINSLTVPGTIEKTLEKKNGYSSRFQTSVEIKAGVSAGIFGCNASLEVSTGFTYEETITSETTETWREILESGSYVIYQNCVLYAYWVQQPGGINGAVKVARLMGEYAESGIQWYEREGESYFFVPVFRNDPFTLKYTDALYAPVPYNDIISYVTNSGSNRW